MTHLASFIDERRRQINENKRLDELVSRYRTEMSVISAKWDLSQEVVNFNEISEIILAGGIIIYSCKVADLWSGLSDPSMYSAETILGDHQIKHKIAKVIEA